jgi:8-oxo-dGTP pyrophosphatase MutT (NUDIX family)
MTPAEQIALWADRLSAISATGLRFTKDFYDREHYEIIQQIALEMLALANGQQLDELEPLRQTLLVHPTPFVAGTAAVIDEDGMILLQHRADNLLWSMPGGALEVGETPAQGVVREVLEETGIGCEPVALVGVYDKRLWKARVAQHIYIFTFLCRPLDGKNIAQPASHMLETVEIGWFAEHDLPEELSEGHRQRISHAFQAWRGNQRTYFDHGED